MEECGFKNIWTFIPCHNEAGNVTPLTEAILALGIPNMHIAIINDASKDDTGTLADMLTAKYPQVRVVHRTPPNGRALAGKTGFRFCLDQGADVIIEMDADFSHHPRHIPELLRTLASGADVALGSRFVPGGSDARASALRNTISRASVFFYRSILGIRLRDMGSGFKAYRRKAAESVDPDNALSRKGIAISIESIFRVLKAGFKVVEIPIIFEDRKVGESKLTAIDFLEPAWIALKLRGKLGRLA